jgi:hypothetical protein
MESIDEQYLQSYNFIKSIGSSFASKEDLVLKIDSFEYKVPKIKLVHKDIQSEEEYYIVRTKELEELKKLSVEIKSLSEIDKNNLEKQGWEVQNLESYIEEAKEYIQESEKEIIKAKENMKSSWNFTNFLLYSSTAIAGVLSYCILKK